MDSYVRDIAEKTILDYGCGRGDKSLLYLARGAYVFGIDISVEYIEDAKESAKKAGYSENQFSFVAMDAHKLNFDDDFFDIVIGYGILHHLDTAIALDEIHRVLKPQGRLLLQEPLANNPLLRIFRFLTPYARTEDERPFSAKDIEMIGRDKRSDMGFEYCGLIEAPIAMLTSALYPNSPDNWLLRFADRLELWTHQKNFLLSWNQYVLLNGVEK
jgi:SAM-dependent methyltransferase